MVSGLCILRTLKAVRSLKGSTNLLILILTKKFKKAENHLENVKGVLKTNKHNTAKLI